MLNNQYPTMNPIENSMLLAYLGNYGLFYANNGNIPNPWIMIPNPYYLKNLSLTFSNTLRPMTYPFLNMVFTIITATKGCHGVLAYVMTPLITTLINRFSTENPMPYLQPPTRNPPSRVSNFGGGIPSRGNGSPLHGSEGPLEGGSGPLEGGGGAPSIGGPPSGRRPLGKGRGGFPIGSTGVSFSAPWSSSP
jgi:hypothetical protein